MKSIKKFFKNKNPWLLGIFVAIILLIILLLALRSPDFPNDIPSSEKREVQNEYHQKQKEFFDRYSRFVRDNHGGLIAAEEAEEEKAQGMSNGLFIQKFKYFDRLVIDRLTAVFVKKEGVQFQILSDLDDYNRTSPLNKITIEFIKNGKRWVSVTAEILKYYTDDSRSRIQSVKEEKSNKSGLLKNEGGLRKFVIIIDDLGNRMNVFNRLISLDYNITYSILPQLSFSQETAEIVHSKGLDIMLHLPMEPKEMNRYNPGIGALLLSDETDTIVEKMILNLDSVPYAIGANNHMGSAYTQYKEGLDVVMKILNEREMFFLDSKTAPGRISQRSAKRNGIPYLSRDIFLDNEQNVEAIKEQLFKAAKIANKRGEVIVIGHPYMATYEALAKYLPEIENQGIRITKVSELIN